MTVMLMDKLKRASGEKAQKRHRESVSIRKADERKGAKYEPTRWE
jgi:hypothetical protein